MADAALLEHYRANPASENQMHRWLGCRDAYVEIVVHARREAGILREQKRLMHPWWVRRRAALTEQIERWDALARRYQESFEGVKACYDASKQGRAEHDTATEVLGKDSVQS